MKKSREEQAVYLRNVEGFQSSRRVLQSAAKTMLDALSLDAFDKLINQTRKNMTGAWTTHGLKIRHADVLRRRARDHGPGFAAGRTDAHADPRDLPQIP
jgi:hypothetical protein